MTFCFGSSRSWVWSSLLLLSPTGLVVKIVSQDVGNPGPAPSSAQGQFHALTALSAPPVEALPFLYGVHKYLLGQVRVSPWPRGHHLSSEAEKPFHILAPIIIEYQILKCSLQHVACHQDFLIWV